MFGLGPTELLIILVLVLFFYGGKKMPQLGEGLGRGIKEFKQAIRGEDERTAQTTAVVQPSGDQVRARDNEPPTLTSEGK